MPSTAWASPSLVSSAWAARALPPTAQSTTTSSVVTSTTTAPGSGDTLAYDTFIDTLGTLLQNHVGDSGVTYAKHPTQPGDGSVQISTASDIFYDNFDQFAVGMGVNYIVYANPASADYSSAASYIMRSAMAGTADGIGVGVRGDSIARTQYLAWWNNQIANWELYRIVAGAGTLLGSISTELLLTAAAARAVALTAQGNGSRVTLTFTVDGTDIMQVADTNAARIVAAGQPGIRFYNVTSGASNGTKLHMDNLLVKTLTSVVTSTTTSSVASVIDSALWTGSALPATTWTALA